MSNNRINKVAIVGATGHIGSHIVDELLKNGRIDITAISRQDSEATFPEGVKVARVDYTSEESLAEALRGHDFLIISLRSRVNPEVQPTICNAAVKAGITWIMPNAYGMDTNNTTLLTENIYGPVAQKAMNDVRNAGANYIVLACSFWYEWSLMGGPDLYGIDITKHEAVLFDDGTQKINTSTLKQCGRAVAALLDLPVAKEDIDKPALEDWKNESLYVSSFLLNQRDMLSAVQRADGSTDADWTITYENAEERTKSGLEAMQKGDFAGFARTMYTRMFYKTGKGPYEKAGDGNYESVWGLANGVLGLPKEDLDEVTKWAVEKKLRDGFVYA